MAAPQTVFFVSDYGLKDEFVGVVHAVIRRHAPGTSVLDLTHGLPPFDLRAGEQVLLRAVPHLGHGVVLAIVDPGVGGARRGVAVRGSDGRWFVGPDNGVIPPAAERTGAIAEVIDLKKPDDAPPTFDGRDVFAPAAALLASGGDPSLLGERVEPRTLVRLAPPESSLSVEDGRHHLRAEVTWVDHFGNVQLATAGHDGPPLGSGLTALRTVDAGLDMGAAAGIAAVVARRVATFSDLGVGELGLLSDANGHLALAVREGSAAAFTHLDEGGAVELVW